MNIPNLTAFVTSNSRRPDALERFEVNIQKLQKGLDEKHIWNVDFVEAKDALVRLCDEAKEAKAMEWLRSEKAKDRDTRYAPDDVRWSVYYTPQVSNMPGAYKRLLKFVGTGEGPEFDSAVEMFGEIAQVAELIKSLKPYIEKGRKPSENPKEVDVTNTGICPVCFKRHKLSFNSTLVAHGYTIPRGWGGRNGMCMGHGFKAWELAPDGALAFKEAMEKLLANMEKQLADYKASNHEELKDKVRVRKGEGLYARYVDEVRTYAKGTREYERIRESSIYSLESSIRYITSDLETITSRIANWKPEPLKYGGAETQERFKSRLLQKGK